ncbi:MAG: hypothetical protein KJ893_02735 [Candidatus Omnitrophica bacterium]|nr:hypothetical protein [Candidatus Omnitrophota bacterium]MBU4478669.1 hypothetical protein [Candidatus Omnitrophota bacterium]
MFVSAIHQEVIDESGKTAEVRQNSVGVLDEKNFSELRAEDLIGQAI